ncbi:glycosyltransferase [Cyanobium sp. WAJ14-Wanaka]|uniref:glycosyltransferase n=1 Tax=Cyanobium sp. WAJ14-Wanaka TaxID=2823725 RepID=UPI0020CF1293|nr:glycosyltransferase [Cyanobium sp. WAJ14-Wanaka]MCP9775634.1 hypothetical protein [Cyanobium sp. WAJ14-Wanaka]
MVIQLPWSDLWVLGCAQNCAAALPAVLANIDRLRPWFDNSGLLILENDSKDATAEVLRAYARGGSGNHAFSLPGLADRLPIKTERLAHLRNGGLAWLRQRGLLAENSLLMILDLDEVNADPWSLEAVAEVLQWFAGKPQAAAVFANQRGPYYDLWALRHPQLCPDDIWERQLELHLERPELSDQDLLEAVLTPRQFSLPLDGKPLAVESAFGGLGFYRGSWLRRLPEVAYVGSRSRWIETGDGGVRLIRWQCAEHVAFHGQLRSAGAELWVHPRLVNWTTPQIRLNPATWRHLQC